ncbi:MAG TPA: ArsR family transcriptional regulator, partial [Armatimonadota bacterium]|nr:ArsR family transcriptional regulator [Armatimonadota bacterium]
MAEAVDTVHYIDAERVAAVRAAQIDDLLLRDLAATFHALGDPTRVKLIFALSRAELCVCDLAALLEVSV